MALLLRLALRDLRGGLNGFFVFMACIALGVTAIAGVGSLSRSLQDGLARQGRVILGGDVSFDLAQRPAKADELRFMRAHGRVASVSLLRAMARRGDATALVEIKAVDKAYPLVGAVATTPALPLGEAFDQSGGLGIVAEPALGARLGLKVGDTVTIGAATFRVRALLDREPDRLAVGIGLGPRVLMSEAGLAATGLVQPGSLVRRLYRVLLNGPVANRPVNADALHAFVAEAARTFPEAGWEVRTRENVSPQFSRDLERFTQFLTLVGLTTLVVGGVGVANAVAGFVARKRGATATLKALGAPGTLVFAVMLTEVMLIAVLGTAAGLAVGAAVPWIVAGLFNGVLPFALVPSFYVAELGTAAFYGLWTALVFSIVPLGYAHDTPVSVLFRDKVDLGGQRLRPRYRVLALLAGVVFVAVVLILSQQRMLTSIYLLSVAGAFAVLRALAFAVTFGVRRAPRSRRFAVRLAIANIVRPGALTSTVILSLGLGLALLVALTLIDANIRAQLRQPSIGETPSFFFIDIQNSEAAAFRQYLQARAEKAALEFVPMMRGRIVDVNGTAAEKVKPSEKAAWVLQGDRGITFSAELPAGSRLVQGTWWPPDYDGKPLVSLEKEIADGLDLKIGDTVAVNVFGRTITATIANLRKVDWRKFGINFVLVFSPNTFAGAPYSDLATLTWHDSGRPERELALLKEVAQAYPAITMIRVRDALDAVTAVVGQLATAIRGAASIALVSSVLVLAGAIAAGQQARLFDTVVLKSLGATRPRLLAAMLLEYAILGLTTAGVGILAGSAAAYGVVAHVMSLDFHFQWGQAAAAALGSTAIIVALGLAGTWRVLGQKPAPYLRDL